MTIDRSNKKIIKFLPVFFGAGLIITFFLPWVSWDGNLVSGYDMPKGHFFNLAETRFKLGNPFPKLNFSFFVFWLIPVCALLSVSGFVLNKKWNSVSFISGFLSLSLLTVFFLFTQKLIILGYGSNVFEMLQAAAWLHAFFAIGLIITTKVASYNLLKKAVWVLLGPLFVFISFLLMENYIMNETFSETAALKSDYAVMATELIHEFAANDSVANNKYREKIVSVNGTASEVETKSDSTINIKFTDSGGSFIIFSLDKGQYANAKNIKAGDSVSLKGSCSGSVYSNILSTTAISFKRSTLNNK